MQLPGGAKTSALALYILYKNRLQLYAREEGLNVNIGLGRIVLIKKIGIGAVICAVVLMTPLGAHASLQDLNAQKKALQDSIAQSQQQKKQQQDVLSQLNAEINKLNGSITDTNNTIAAISNNITDVSHHISDLTGQINQQTDLINQEKDRLQQTINNMYIDDSETNPALLLVQSQTISQAVSDLQSYQALETQIEQKAKHIEDLKADLESKRADMEKQQGSLKSLQEQQQQQKSALEAQKNLKLSLTSQTISSISQLDGTIQQYQNQVRAVDGKISQFLAALKLQDGYVAAAGDFVVTNSAPWHYFQTDPRWGNQPLDPTSSDSDSFAESGCLVTSITMVANRFGFSGTPPQILAQLRAAGGMYGDLVAWGGVGDAFGGKLDFVSGGKQPFNASLLDADLSAGLPDIVHIAGGGSGHWIVIDAKVGDKYSVEDPYFQTGRVYPAKWIDFMARLRPM